MATPPSAAGPSRTSVELPVRLDLAAIALHDLRSPLSVILGYTQRILHRAQQPGMLDATVLRHHIEAIEVAAQRMRTVVDELSDIVALQHGQPLSLRLETLNLATLVQEVGQMASAAHGGSAVAIQAPSTVLLVADRARLSRALYNVVDNAVKFSRPDQEVSVTVHQCLGWIRLTVRDRGVGVPALEMPALGTPYYRASTAAHVDGTGLGLAGTIAIVEQHGGRVVVESAPGQGTSVCIQVPQVPPYTP